MPRFLPSREPSSPAIARAGAHYSYSAPVEAGPPAGAILSQRALRPGCVGPGEDPVLPRRQPPEDLGLRGLRAGEPVVRLHAGQRVRAETAPLLDGDADFLGPVDVVRRERDQAQPLGILGLEELPGLL